MEMPVGYVGENTGSLRRHTYFTSESHSFVSRLLAKSGKAGVVCAQTGGMVNLVLAQFAHEYYRIVLAVFLSLGGECDIVSREAIADGGFYVEFAYCVFRSRVALAVVLHRLIR